MAPSFHVLRASNTLHRILCSTLHTVWVGEAIRWMGEAIRWVGEAIRWVGEGVLPFAGTGIYLTVIVS